MDSLNNWGDQSPTTHLIHLSETSSARSGLQLIELSAKHSQWKFQTTQKMIKASDCFPPTDGKSLLLRIKLTYLNEHRRGI